MSRVVHFEIHAKDMDAMQKFYEQVFGWEFQKMGEDMGGYRVIVTAQVPKGEEGNTKWAGINGGLTPRRGDLPQNGAPVNAFVNIIGVENIDETIAKIESAGGTLALAKMDVPTVGLLAYYKDPDGNIFGIIQAIMPQPQA
jgi:predicted enzyme related to lactoylglutathione lyase